MVVLMLPGIQVPVFYGHTLALTVDLKRPARDIAEVENLF